MKRVTLTAVALTCTILVAACGQEPTSPTTYFPDAARLDSGVYIGSGSRADSTDTVETTTDPAITTDEEQQP